MVEQIEKEIHQLLLSQQSPKLIAKKLLRKKTLWSEDENPEAFLAICNFMWHAGLYKLIIKTTISRLKKKEFVPWSILIDIIEDQKISIDNEKKLFFIKGIIEQKQVPYMLTNHKWDKIHLPLKKLKNQIIKKKYKKNNKAFIQLIEDLEFIQAQGVLKKEEEILKKLKKIDPDNPEIQEKWLNFREKWSRYLLHEKKASLPYKKNFLDKGFTEQEKKQAEDMAQYIIPILKKNPEKSQDMALLFSFIGYDLLAIKLLKNNLKSMASKWLYSELLLQSHLFLECLSFLDIMEIEYKNNPETIFALTYLRAKAYYGLGKTEKAKSILSDLLKVRPNYRLTHYLLKKWNKKEIK